MEYQPQHIVIQKGNPYHLTNHRPIALENTIQKLFTNTLINILSTHDERYQILYERQEQFKADICTSWQLQILISTLEDARFKYI